MERNKEGKWFIIFSHEKKFFQVNQLYIAWDRMVRYKSSTPELLETGTRSHLLQKMKVRNSIITAVQ